MPNADKLKPSDATTTEPAMPRKTPCASCPYRKNVPSGVWDESEYQKLPRYDGEMHEQNADATFMCHQQDGCVCSGWLGHRDPEGMLAVRLGVMRGHLDPSVLDYTTDVPLFASGAEAAEHGMKELLSPNEDAVAVMLKIVRKNDLPSPTTKAAVKQ